MPPRSPLPSSSSFSLLPMSEVHSSIELGSSFTRTTYNQSVLDKYAKDSLTTIPYEETHILPKEGNFITTNDEEIDGGLKDSYPGYGGAGYYSEPLHKGRTTRPFGRDSASHNYTKKKEKGTAASIVSSIKNNNNMTRRVGTWLAASYIFRQLVYIITIGLVLWVPGILALLIYGASPQNGFNRPTALSVGLFWWSVWLSSAWLAIWVCSMVASFAPILLRQFLGVLAVTFKDFIVYAEATKRYTAFLLWSIVVWVVYLSTVWSQFPGRSTVEGSIVNPLTGSNSTANSTASSTVTSPLSSLLSIVPSELIGANPATLTSLQSNETWLISLSRFLAGTVICSAILLVEKVAMQWVALSFHQTTYSDRIEVSNYHIAVLTTLYSSAASTPLVTTTVPVLQETADEKQSGSLSTVITRAQKFKKAFTLHQNQGNTRGLIRANLPLQSSQFPFSIQAVVETALESSTQSRKLAKQIFLAFAKSKDAKTGDTVMTELDISTLFKTEKDSQRAFLVLDRDNNDSCTWEEIQASVLGMHQERICLLASLHDVDSAVLKLDNFFMSFYFFISCVIIAALLSTKFSTLVASLGTILLGLSWLVGSTAQESLASIVWVFGKHPVDVGDTIEVPGLVANTISFETDNIFIVEEIQLLSTILKTTTGKQLLISNFQLAQKAILNMRRSGPTQENVIIIVEYCTSFELIEKLRTEMIKWIEMQSRDFLPGLNIELNALGDQSKLSLTLDIRYKSNWQDEHLKAIRKNRWVAELKSIMTQLNIYGPNGKPDKSETSTNNTGLNRAKSFSLMDERNAVKDEQFSSKKKSSDTILQAQLPSRLNEAMPSSASSHQHGNPTTHLTSLNVPGMRPHSEQIGDLERGKRNSPF